jgi:hypothetical protein
MTRCAVTPPLTTPVRSMPTLSTSGDAYVFVPWDAQTA